MSNKVLLTLWNTVEELAENLMERPLNCGRLRREAAAARARLGPSLARWPIPSLGRDSGGATKARPYDGPPVIDSAGSRLVWRPTRQLVAFRGQGSIDWLCL